MGSSDPEGNLSTSKETVPFLGLLFLQTDSPFELGIMDDFCSVPKQSSHQVLQNAAFEIPR